MSSEQLAQPPISLELLTRRSILRAALGLGATAMGITVGKNIYAPVRVAIDKYRSMDDDFSNQVFYDEVGAHNIDRGRLDELIGDETDTPVALYRLPEHEQEDSDALAEYVLDLDRDGPVFAEFDGLYGEGVSLTILRAVVDDKEGFLLPLLRSEDDQWPASIQLGSLAEGHHRLQLFEEHAGVPVTPGEAIPRITQGTTGTIRGFLEMNQPDIFLRDYRNITNNFPWRSYVEVCETDENLAVVYKTECLDEDLEYGMFGTSVQRLVETKDRPTDSDWGAELLISKRDGSVRVMNIATPFHSRRRVPVDPDNPVPHIPLRIASLNNNLNLVTNPSVLDAPKLRFRPIILTRDEMRDRSHTTGPSAARQSLCENYDEGSISPRNETDAAILERFDLDVRDCRD